jgi:hypothetical protein
MRAMHPARLSLAIALAGALAAAAVPTARAGVAPVAMPIAADTPRRDTSAMDSVRTIDVKAPAVIAIWAPPPNDSFLDTDEGLATLYDDFMYYWADTRPRLDSLRIAALDEPVEWYDRRLRIRVARRTWPVALPDDVPVGYVFVAPDGPPHLHLGVMVDEELADTARVLTRSRRTP